MSDKADLPQCWVVVPAYNEAEVIAETLGGLREFFQNIVVVDDCSDDRTGEIALKHGAHVCRHAVNLGQGAALQTGIDWALSCGADVVVTFDADGQHLAKDAFRMCKILEASSVDVVLGSRFLGEAHGITGSRSFLLRLATWITRATTGMDVTDTHNGIRAFRASALRKFRITQNRMAHASEILEAIVMNGLSYTEAPVTIIYTDYSIRKGQTALGGIEIILDLILSRAAK